MDYVYIDESGGEGIGSKFLVFASVSVNDPRMLEKAIKKLWRTKPQFHVQGEFHAKAVDDSTRKRVLLCLADLSLVVRCHIIDKSEHRSDFRSLYYTELAQFINFHHGAQTIMIDKKDTISVRNRAIRQHGLNRSYQNVQFEESHKAKQLQAADFVAWSVGRKYEHSDSSFYDLIRHKESPLF